MADSPLLRRVKDNVIEQMVCNQKRSGIKIDEYVKHIGTTTPTYIKMVGTQKKSKQGEPFNKGFLIVVRALGLDEVEVGKVLTKLSYQKRTGEQ